MVRIRELVRIATLARHYKDGIVAVVEIIADGERWSVCVRYNDKAEGEKTRFLTSNRTAGARRFVSLSTIWKVLNEHGIDYIVVRKATPEDQIP